MTRTRCAVGDRGPALLEDFHFREKIFHFDHERIPERVVHARGYGAHGYFENYEPLTDLTRADLFQRAGEQTPAFVRFSTVAGNKGSSDLARDVRGFAVKLYTQKGNWDLVGNNIPVFFIQDPIKFPDLIHAAKQEPDRGFPQAADRARQLLGLRVARARVDAHVDVGDVGPRHPAVVPLHGGLRRAHRSGSSTPRAGRRYVKFHWKPKLGLQSVAWNEAVKINGADPDFHRRDLWDAITTGDFPEWELGVQVFDDDFADQLRLRRARPDEDHPRGGRCRSDAIGRLVLDRVVDNFFAETEQVAFCTQNVVAGIDFTNDPLLQGRNFSYLDTQLKRLGSPNFTDLPVNAPKCPFATFQQDGHMALTNPVGRANYEPNSWPGRRRRCRARTPTAGSPRSPSASRATSVGVRPESFADHYSQARQFYVSQTPVEQKHIADAFVFELSKVERVDIRERMVANLRNVDEDLAQQVADVLGLERAPSDDGTRGRSRAPTWPSRRR